MAVSGFEKKGWGRSSFNQASAESEAKSEQAAAQAHREEGYQRRHS